MEEEGKEEGGGSPAWLATFADLMSLLLTFFVLLLSFADMDVKRFQEAAGSVKDAFGVQTVQFFPDTQSAINPIKDRYSQGSQSWIDLQFNEAVLNIDNRAFCEIEKDRLRRDREESKLKVAQMMSEAEKLFVSELSSGKLQLRQESEAIRINVKSQLFKSGQPQFSQAAEETLEKLKQFMSKNYGQASIDYYLMTTAANPQNRQRAWGLQSQRAQTLLFTLASKDEDLFERLSIDAKTQGYRDEVNNDLELVVKIFKRNVASAGNQ